MKQLDLLVNKLVSEVYWNIYIFTYIYFSVFKIYKTKNMNLVIIKMEYSQSNSHPVFTVLHIFKVISKSQTI